MLRADPAIRRTERRAAQDTWVDHGILAVVFALLLYGFRTTIQGNDWWATTVMVAALTGLTCAVLRAIGSRWVAPIALLVELLALAWIFVPSTLLVVVPTPGTFRGLGKLALAAEQIIIEEQAPVAAARPVVLVVASAFGLLVIVADLLLERRRSAQTLGLLFLAVFVAPAMISGTTPSVWLFLAVAALWLVVLRSRTMVGGDLGRRHRGPAMILAASALAAAVAFPIVSPDISAVAAAWGKPPPTVFGRGINPMLELGQNLRRNSSVVALTYTTSLDSPPYLKVATLRNFTGKTWKPSSTNSTDRFEGDVGLDPEIKSDVASTTISVNQLRSSMLPVPYPAVEVTGLKGSWRWERMGMTVRSSGSDSRGQKYSVSSLDIAPTAEQMRRLKTVVGPSLGPYVDLPANVPAVIARTARSVTSGKTNDYDKALALQDYLRNGPFEYSETSPVADGYDGNGLSVIAKFLKAKSGYCVHFSSAMAVMARTLGIPSRIAVGYAPGEVSGQLRGQNQYEVTSDDLHAWTELYFEGAGWTKFEPTPGVGSATSFREPNAPDATPDKGTAAGADGQLAPRDAPRLDSGPASTPTSAQTAPRTALVTLAGILLVVVAPGLVRWARRRWRLRRGTASPDPLWRELEDTARDLGVRTSPADTPRGFASRLRQRPAVDTDCLDLLLHRVETARFARAAGLHGDGVGDLRAVMTSLRAGASRPERVRAALLPVSLAGQRPYVAVRPALAPS